MSVKRKKLGILGGGQLARMMTLKAQEMGIEAHILSSNPQDPAAQVTQFWTRGRLDSLSDLKKFLNKVDVASFENEFVNTRVLIQAMKESKTQITPHPKIIQNIQDRYFQKKLLEKNKIPSSPFVKIENEDQLEAAYEKFKGKMVLKQRLFGYDGKGTFVIKNRKDLKKIDLKKGFIAEAFIPFKKELALILVSGSEKIISLPLVETHQKDFKCFYVKGPVRHPQAQKFTGLLKKFLKKIKYKGVMAFEIFDHKGQLLVNELAPRVHNSGHYSLNALSLDQFTLHILAVLKWPLQEPKLLYPGFAMLNLLGKTQKSSGWGKISGLFLHDYGKVKKTKGRKMGHLNACADSPEKALEKALKSQKYFS